MIKLGNDIKDANDSNRENISKVNEEDSSSHHANNWIPDREGEVVIEERKEGDNSWNQ